MVLLIRDSPENKVVVTEGKSNLDEIVSKSDYCLMIQSMIGEGKTDRLSTMTEFTRLMYGFFEEDRDKSEWRFTEAIFTK